MITIHAPHNVMKAHKEIIDQQEVLNSMTYNSFVEDFENSLQFVRLLDNQLMYFKHKLVPEAIKNNKQEVMLNIAVDKFLAPWIIDSSIHKSLALKSFFNQLRRKLPIGYTIVQHSTTESMFTITW